MIDAQLQSMIDEVLPSLPKLSPSTIERFSIAPI
jgi:hypothetical protein